VAVVYREEYITKFFENTAVNLGVLVSVVAGKQAALQWLLEGQSKKADQATASSSS
jgi:hypothetical protein